MGIADGSAAHATRRYLKLLGDCVRSRGLRIAWAFVRENDDGDGRKGSHVHILAHVPAGVQLSTMHRRWGALLAGGRYVGRSIDTRRIGGTVNAWRTSPGAYAANLERTLEYCLKGSSAAAATALGRSRHNEGGSVIGKRLGRSQNLGHT
jgi:hypothetical protein